MTKHRPTDLPQNLTDRVQVRVNNARLLVDRRANASRPLSKPRRLTRSASTESLGFEQVREYQSLKRVFRDFGVSYRRYRSQTKSRLAPGLRDAAYNFRAEPSLTSLVVVAGFLDELDLLS
jgi:hypothetical protein